jgi:peptide/nickel transport system permease protein
MSVINRLTKRISLTKNSRAELELYKEQLLNSWNRFRKNRAAMFGLIVVGLFILMGLVGPYIAPYDPFTSHQTASGMQAILQPPSLEHPMGTTSLGRDVLTQWIYGVRVSLLVALLSGLSVLMVGTTVGLISGYYKGKVDLVVMRVVDVLYAIPATPLILVIALFFGSSVWNVIIGMVLVLWRTMARVIRSQTMSLSERPFVKAAKASGASDLRIMYVHIAPNLVPLMLVEGTFVMGAAIILEAGISFLGLGATEMISWGSMLQLTFSSGAINQAWWWVLPPGLSITLLVVSLFYISRGIEDVTNPELNR